MLIIGHVQSENTVIALPIATSRNALLFTPCSATTRSRGGDGLLFRALVDDSLYGQCIAKRLTEKHTSAVAFRMDMSHPSFVEAVTLVAEALRHYLTSTVEEFKHQRFTGTFTALLGEAHFDRFGHVRRPVYPVQSKGSRFVTVQQLE